MGGLQVAENSCAQGLRRDSQGDAPVHSIGAALFARKDQIHFFEDIGYRHEPFQVGLGASQPRYFADTPHPLQHCPQGAAHARGRCWCDINNNFDWEWYSCTNKYKALFE